MDDNKKALQVAFKSEVDLKTVLANQYQKQIVNFFGDQKQALRFLSGVVAAVQRNPKLLECTGESVINSFMTMAQLGLMPSDVSGEAYVIPYRNKKNIDGKWVDVMEAQFQLGYQGLVTLFYRAGVRKIVGELVRENEAFEYVNGEITHKVDPFAQRGSRRGAYCIVTLANGEKVSKVMSKDEILEIAENFSKSYGATKKDGSKAKTPWDEDQDPQGWMWIKTVLKQLGKLLPKNEKILQAIAEDNKDSVIADRLPEAMEIKEALTMGAILKKTDEHDHAESTTQTPGKEAGNAAEDHGSDE